MRHRKQGRKLGRTASHRKALRRNLTLSLFTHERITTTPAKAKETRRLAEKMITLAKDGSLHSRRRAFSFLQDRDVVDKLFDDIGPRYQDRNGGYTRILHLDRHRLGDNARQVVFELIAPDEEKPDKRKAAPKTKKTDKADAPAGEPVEAQTEAPAEDAAEEKPEEAPAAEEAPEPAEENEEKPEAEEEKGKKE